MSSRRDLSAVLVYPNTPEVAFASLGFLKVFEMLKGKVALADVSFLPVRYGRGPGHGVNRARGGGRSWQPGPGEIGVLSPRHKVLLGHFTRREVRSFDIIAFSVSYENDLVHVPELLLASGVEPLASKRADVSRLVLFGGFVMSLNPLPVADFADAIVIGEAEPVLGSVLSAISGVLEPASAARATAEGPGEDEAAIRWGLLERLGAIPGVYVPSLHDTSAGGFKVTRVWAATDGIAPEPAAEPRSHFGDMCLVEVGRGCGRGCLFCAAGNLYRPVRRRGASTVLAQAGGASKVGLVGTAVGDHPSLVPILRDLTGAGRQVGISSFRADEITPEIAELLVRGGIKTLAIAPETGSESLRRRINKIISDGQIEDAVKMLAEAGIQTIKLYFMIGLPWETDRDVAAIPELVERLSRVRGRARLAVAAGPFVPKPHTAFQWSPFADLKTLKRRAGILGGVRRIKGCSLKLGSLEEAWLEAVLARGDRSLGVLLLDAAEKKVPFRALVKRLIKDRPDLDPTRAPDVTKPLPWDFIDAGVSGKRLEADFLRAQHG